MTPNQKNWKKEFREIWANYPKNVHDNALGLDKIIEDFISKTIKEEVEKEREKLLERIEFKKIIQKTFKTMADYMIKDGNITEEERISVMAVGNQLEMDLEKLKEEIKNDKT